MAVDQIFSRAMPESSSAHTTPQYQVVEDELRALTDTLLTGEVVLDRAASEELVRVLGAVVSLHADHRVDRHGRCSICRPARRSRWSRSAKHDVCSVYTALNVHLGGLLGSPPSRDR